MTTIRSRAVILDLDDTLYLERDYVRSGFAEVGRQIAKRFGVQDFGDRCWSLFESGVRRTTFNDVADEIGLDGSLDVAELVEIYRNHVPSISLAADAAAFLDRWPVDRPLGLISDGSVACQSAKIGALHLHDKLHPIVLSDRFGVEFRKPHDRPFEEVERVLGLQCGDLTYIADNPRKDFVAPARRGWHTIRIRRALGEHSLRDDPADCLAEAEIRTFEDLVW